MKNTTYSLLALLGLSACGTAAPEVNPSHNIEAHNHLCIATNRHSLGTGKISVVSSISDVYEEEEKYKVTYGKDFSGLLKVIISNADGSKECTKYDARSPIPSPDGAAVLYTGEVYNDYTVPGNVFLMTPQGETLDQTTLFKDPLFRPSWKEDNSAIIYAAWENSKGIKIDVAEIYHYDFNTKEKRKLTSLGRISTDPMWCADKIIFGSSFKMPYSDHIYRMNHDGSNVELIGYGEGPQCSPDRKKIAFFDYQGIWIMNLDGSEKTNLSKACLPLSFSCKLPEGINSSYEDHSEPRWSPDGKYITYVAETGQKEGAAAMFRLEMIETFDLHQKLVLTQNDVSSRYVSWSPEGKSFAYLESDDPTEPGRIKIMNIDTLTSTLFRDVKMPEHEASYLHWSP